MSETPKTAADPTQRTPCWRNSPPLKLDLGDSPPNSTSSTSLPDGAAAGSHSRPQVAKRSIPFRKSRGSAGQSTPVTKEDGEHRDASSDEEGENNFGPARITQEGGRQVLRYKSKIVSGKEFVFDCSAKGSSKGLIYFRCRGCAEEEKRRLPTRACVRTVNVCNGIMVTDPEKPSGIRHICIPSDRAPRKSANGSASTPVTPKNCANKATGAAGEDASNPSSPKKPCLRKTSATVPAQTGTPLRSPPNENNDPAQPSNTMKPSSPIASATSSATKQQPDYAANFGPAIYDKDPSVVSYENIFGDTYTFKMIQEREVKKDGVTSIVRTYRCQDCMEVAKRHQLKRDIPLVKTVDDVFVERDPDAPLGNNHLCAQSN